MGKKKRNLSDCITLLTHIWIKWMDNREKADNNLIAIEIRKNSAIRCENAQYFRRLLIENIDQLILEQIKNENKNENKNDKSPK
jgi:hypothetical protein